MPTLHTTFVPLHFAHPFRPRIPLLRCGSTAPPFPSRNRRSSPRHHPFACAQSPGQSLSDIQLSLENHIQTAQTDIEQVSDLRQLDAIRVEYLGKKGSITSVLKTIGRLPPADRPALGASVNEAKATITDLIAAKKTALEEAKIKEEEENEDWIDVTMPGLRPRKMVGRIHPITSTMDLAIDIFTDLGYDLIDDDDLNREIETDYYCFEALNCPKDHPAREMQDTFYMDESKTRLLRTQTSAVQIRYMEQNKPPFAIIAPGRVYRRDTVDATHTSTFHQIEILSVDKMGVLNLGHLKGVVIHFLEKMFGSEIKTRFRGSYFPFTEPSMEVDVLFRGKWLEVLGCGMVHPKVLQNVGLDPMEYSGFAAGFGVERFAMVMHEITDIRELYKNDMRFIVQGMY